MRSRNNECHLFKGTNALNLWKWILIKNHIKTNIIIKLIPKSMKF